MTPSEVLVACTANAAAALDVHKRTGAIRVGFDADLAVLDLSSLQEWFYTPGRPRVRSVLKGGHIVYKRHEHAM
jgi:imidazolonepropionase